MSTAPQVERLPVGDRADSFAGVRDWLQAHIVKAWSALKWITRRVKVRQVHKSLRVCENVSLGEKCFVAVVQVDEERFLIGGSAGSVSLLSRLHAAKTFAAALDREAKKIS
jgi:flagellar biogenesis protein FliO